MEEKYNNGKSEAIDKMGKETTHLRKRIEKETRVHACVCVCVCACVFGCVCERDCVRDRLWEGIDIPRKS